MIELFLWLVCVGWGGRPAPACLAGGPDADPVGRRPLAVAARAHGPPATGWIAPTELHVLRDGLVMTRKSSHAGFAPAAALIDEKLHRFPWPAEASRRYSLKTPWLAVVNARGPWAVWHHWQEKSPPPWLPLHRGLWGKEPFRSADPAGRMFMLTFWQWAAGEDYWGIVWGDPLRIGYEVCRRAGCSPEVGSRMLAAMAQHGFLAYLSFEEKQLVERCAKGKQRGDKGKERGTIGGEDRDQGGQGDRRQGRGDSGQQRDDKRARGPQQAQQKTTARALAGSQVTDSRQTTEHRGQRTEDRGETTDDRRQTRAQRPEARGDTPEPRADSGTDEKPANLPESDLRTGKRSSRRASRSASVSEPQTLGTFLHWGDPQAVEFGRAMCEAVTGKAAPADLEGASDAEKSIVGVWAKAWRTKFAASISPGDYSDFVARCVKNVSKKRGRRGVYNLGAVAMSRIVPGIVGAMSRRQ